MRIILFFVFFLLAGSSSLFAQTLSPSVIPSSGGTDMASGVQLQWTLGEPAIESFQGAKQRYTEGFNQPILKLQWLDPHSFSPPVQEKYMDLTSDGSIQIYPNPTAAVLTMDLQFRDLDEVCLMLSQIDGSPILTDIRIPAMGCSQIDLSGFASGLYLLKIRTTEGQILATYKISKIN